jgi:protein SCO1/2
MRQRSSISFFIAMVFVIPVLAWVLVSWYEQEMEALPVLGGKKTKGGKIADHYVSDYRLLNQDGQWKNTANWQDKIVVADFFFTHCPVICPKMTESMKRVEAVFRDDKDVIFVSFSVDPERDSAAQLKKYANRFGIDTRKWDLFTGDKKEIYKLARNSFMIVATDGDGGPGDFIHSDKLVLVDPKKRIRGYYDGTAAKEINQLLTDIKKLKNEN